MLIASAVEKHADAFDYSYVGAYENISKKVKILHKKCGNVFLQSLHCHAVRGHGCPICDISKKCTTKDFLEKCTKMGLHNRYTLDMVEYVNSASKVKIGCRVCLREFEITPNNFLRGKGCPWCSGKHVDTELFIKRSKEIFGEETYRYDNTVYVDKHERLKIACNSCQEEFFARPFLHYKGYGCPRCRESVNDTLVSRKETTWLDQLDIPLVNRQCPIKVGKYRFKPDAMVENTIYEFYGSYYHGDPRLGKREKSITQTGRTFGEAYDWTLWRERCFIDAGYQVKFVWELDYDAGLLFSKEHPAYTQTF